jgi:hypothetical protein
MSRIRVLFLSSSSCCGQCCGSGIRCLFDPGIRGLLPRDPGWVKIRIRIRNEQPGSYFRELSLETIFWVKILKLFYAYQGSGMGRIRIRDSGLKKFGFGKHPGSATLVVDTEFCILGLYCASRHCTVCLYIPYSYDCELYRDS